MTEGGGEQPPEMVVVMGVVRSRLQRHGEAGVVTDDGSEADTRRAEVVVVTDDGSEADTRRAEVVVVTDDGQETKRR